MKRKYLVMMLAVCMTLSTGVYAAESAENETEETAEMTEETAGTEAAETETEAVVLDAGEAALDGVTLKDTENEQEISYNEEDHCILGLGEFSTVTYTVPENVSGEYDIYLNLSRASNAFVTGSTPVTVTINDGKTEVPCVPIVKCSMEQMGMEGEPTYQTDMGLFRIQENTALNSGDTIVIGGVPGNEFFYNEMYSTSMPAVGDLELYPAGTEVEQGYAGSTFVDTEEEADETDPLSGLEIAWLGSSVTYGQAAEGYSMADEIAANHPATVSYKYAISGTTLADCKSSSAVPTDGEGSHGSYVGRLKQLDTEKDYDLFIVQLSTNDATAGIPMGAISGTTELADQDASTVIGAMEYIIAYVQENWGCPVMFYTGTQYDSEQYGQMVETLLELKDKWGIGVIDLWNDEDMNAVTDEQYAAYMQEDGIHPLREGYVEWWTPKFEEAITAYLAEN